jgi:hypothetical protein
VESRDKIRIEAGIVPEITKTQMGQMHPEKFATTVRKRTRKWQPVSQGGRSVSRRFFLG